MSESILGLLNRMPRPGQPGFTYDQADALDAYVKADEACGKAYDAWQIAKQRRQARYEALERLINDATRAAPVLGQGEPE